MSQKMNMIWRLGGLLFILLAFNVFTLAPALATEVYFNDFEGAAPYAEWSLGTQATTPSGQNFLGANTTYGFGNQTTTLTLTGLPLHNAVTVSFDLFIINTWDGNAGPGPDYWSFTGDSTFTTTFGWLSQQSFPDAYPAVHDAGTDAVERDTLGYARADSVYHLSFTFPHTGDLSVSFAASNLQSVDDESWGLDNVKVEVSAVPLPGTLLLLGSGLLGLSRVRRLRQS